MYLVILDDKGNELPIRRLSLFDVSFKISPGRTGVEQCTFVNLAFIQTGEFEGEVGWAAALGVCAEADGAPFAVIPLEHGQRLFKSNMLNIAPGQLVFGLSDLKPLGKKQPDPEPPVSFWNRFLRV
jgi:hypothetical protein